MEQPNMKKLYKKIAKESEVSVADLKKEMQEAINAAYVQPNFYARCIQCENEVPTLDEFIEYVVNRVSVLEENE